MVGAAAFAGDLPERSSREAADWLQQSLIAALSVSRGASESRCQHQRGSHGPDWRSHGRSTAQDPDLSAGG